MGSVVFLLTLVIVALSQSVNAAGPAWNYTVQHQWGGKCDTGKRQSPINLERSRADPVHWGPLHWNYNNTKFGRVMVKNNGHGFFVSGKEMNKIELTGPGLGPRRYVLAQLHYHWGTFRDGSEHTFYGVHDAGELHLVHYDERYNGLEDALNSGSDVAVAVVGVRLTQAMRKPKGHEQMLIDATSRIMHYGNETMLDMEMYTIHDFLPQDLTHFFRYEGSLTTPGCNEQVVWTVLNEAVTIPMDMIDQFTQCEDRYGNQLNNTARHTQELNGRHVRFNEEVVVVPEKPEEHNAASSLTPFVFTLATAAAAAIASF